MAAIVHTRGKTGTAACVGQGVRIGEAARASGMSARSLRHYEDEGLIVPGRCGNGFRDYCQATIDRVLAIRPLLASGLPVRLIRERLGARIAVLREQQDALDAFL